MSQAEYQRQTDDAFRAVGRYVVEFSQLTSRMRRLVAWRLTIGRDNPMLAELVLGDAMASQIADAFFGLCAYVGHFDEPEERIATNLRNTVKRAIEKRNDIAHGDWWIGLASYDADAIDLPTLIRIRPVRSHGVEKVEELAVADIDALSRKIGLLINDLEEFGQIALGLPLMRSNTPPAGGPRGKTNVSVGEYRVADILALRDGKIARDGPCAAEIARVPYALD